MTAEYTIHELKYYEHGGAKKDQSLFGAFPDRGQLRFVIKASRDINISDVSMILHSDGLGEADGERYRQIDLCRAADDGEDSCFEVTVQTDTLKKLSECGLYYYFYKVTADGKTLELGGELPTALLPLDRAPQRQLLLYDHGFVTPSFIKGGTIYHIFVDRFAPSGRCALKEGAMFNPDWDGGIPQFAPKRGMPLKNNEFFGGDLYGIIEKLDYIKSLGVTTIYLSPIFEAASNHKYDTADYMQVDSMFGGDEAFAELCTACRAVGISVILDGVFNHTGDDSIYFNRYGRYGDGGAYNSKESEFYPWYNFREYPDKYDCWWGVDILPRVNCDEPSYREYMLGDGGVVRKYMRMGASGFRLDVADELSDSFISGIRDAVREEDPDGIVLGEVWEDASNKISYGNRRAYLRGAELDSVMNYPLRNAIIGFILRGESEALREATEGIYRRYPKCVSDSLMNFLGTHDTERILTVLGGETQEGHSSAELSRMRMNADQIALGVRRLKCAYTIAATVFGVPSVFYGDEAGAEGYYDPFCRRPYPWRNQNRELVGFFSAVGALRKTERVFRDGLFRVLECTPNIFAFERTHGADRITVIVTREEPYTYAPDHPFTCLLLTDADMKANMEFAEITVPANTACVFKENK